MAYTKTEWKDQVVENPRTYSMRDNGDNTVTLLDAFGTVTELGTPVNAVNMNHIEDGIAAVETLANTKQDAITGAASTITGSNLTTNRALTSNGSGKVAVSTTTATELGYVHGVTSNIQTQLNAKQSSSDVSTAITNMLKALFPVGSIYIGTQNTCPLASLINGSTWEKVATSLVTEVSIPSTIAVYGNGKTLGLNDGSTNVGLFASGNTSYGIEATTNLFNVNKGTATSGGWLASDKGLGVTTSTNGSSGLIAKSNSITRAKLTVNIWRRTA